MGRIAEVIHIPISVHCHNDFGLASANSLVSVENGASQIHVTVNGLGERAGNASIEEVVMSLHSFYDIKTTIDTTRICPTSELVSRLTGVPIQPNRAIVGENASTIGDSGVPQTDARKSNRSFVATSSSPSR